MPNALRSTLTTLATDFANDVLAALRQMSLDELLAETSRSGGPTRKAMANGSPSSRGRRTPADIEALAGRVVEALKKATGGLRAEELRKRLSIEAKELPMALSAALASKKIKKTGQKRATTYFARS